MSILRFLMVAFIFLLGGCRDGFSQSRTVCVTGYNEYEKKSMSSGWITSQNLAALGILLGVKTETLGVVADHFLVDVMLHLERLLICSGPSQDPKKNSTLARRLKSMK
ncbi:hypothetical protein WMO32_16450 [Xanthomonas oryzae pv. oryzicola]|uniref:hypothetical protein n=1 Tax=Xanthomonas oryzae TaxID=347 RepID=UPI00059AF5C1|nr:hypothetical protein [Xanthomonas oryzae]